MNLNVTSLPLTAIFPYSQNPRIHNKSHIKEIVASIDAFNFTNPILVDENNTILAGHGRYQAAKKLGMNFVPAIILAHLDEAQKKAYRIADNKLTENGKWDIDLLQLELKSLEGLDLSFDLETTGFSTTAIDLILNPEVVQAPEPPLPPLPLSAVTQAGDLWYLGAHRLYCGNSLLSQSYEVLMSGKKAEMVFTDPPYNVKIQGHVSSTKKHPEFAFASGDYSETEFKDFLQTITTHLCHNSQDGSLHYLCMDWRHSHVLLRATGCYSELKNICVWNKETGGMGSLYRSKHEFIFVFKSGKASHTNNIELGKHGRYRTNVWDYPSPHRLTDSIDHPTVKPVALVKDAILDVTRRGEGVLDCFMGSGSTLLAAEECGRVAYGIEYEPRYVDLTIKRWQA